MRITAGILIGIALTRYLDRARWWQRVLWWAFGNGR